MNQNLQGLSLISNSFNITAKSNLNLILNTIGPHLNTFNHYSKTQSSIIILASTDFIKNIEKTSQLQVKFAGKGIQALFKCFSFILLIIGCKQVKFYPHLLTLIKQQFFKPNIFFQYDIQKRNKILSICRNIQIQLISSLSVYDFIQNNSEFLQGFSYLLSKIIGEYSLLTPNTIVDTLRKRFNIDCGKIQISVSKAQCWVLGMQKKIYLIQQNDYFLVISPNTSTQPSPNIYQSLLENRIQSDRSASEHIIVQASEQSTPKFKDNQESIRYRKKSHKNSFGGDFDITGYQQLARLVNKSQIGQKINIEKQVGKKVFSVRLQNYHKDQNNMLNGFPHINEQQQNNKQHLQAFEFNIIENNPLPMKGSNIQTNQKLKSSNQDTQKESKRKQITSSEIFELSSKNLTNRGRFLSMNKPEEQKQRRDCSQIQYKQESLISHPLCMVKLPQPNNFKDQQHFKISFSKKDSDKFVLANSDHIKQQQHYQEQKIQKKLTKNKVITQGQKLRSSLTNFSIGQRSNINEDLYLQKRLQNRRSLLIQSTISPIEQQVLNSLQQHTQQQSLAQPQVKNTLQQQNDRKQKKFWNKSGKQNPLVEEQVRNTLNISQIQTIGNNYIEKLEQNPTINRNYINIFKNKNRKFSYLTQPITMNRNQQFPRNNHLLRESFMEQAAQFQIKQAKQQSQTLRQQKNKSKNPKIHKNSQAITQSNIKKKRFNQNPISFSQMIANININHQNVEDSNFSGHSLKNTNKRAPKLSLDSNIIQFTKNNTLCYNQPQGWAIKQVIYYFGDNRKAQRFIIDRTMVKRQHSFSPQMNKNALINNKSFDIQRAQNNIQDLQIPSQIRSSKQIKNNIKKEQTRENDKQLTKILKNQQDNLQSTNPKESSRKNASFSSQQGIKYINQTLNTTNNLRSTIQTSKSANTLPYSINHVNVQIIQELQQFNGVKNKSQANIPNKQVIYTASCISGPQSPKNLIQINPHSPFHNDKANFNLNSIKVISPTNRKPYKLQNTRKQIRHQVSQNNKQYYPYPMNIPQSSSFQIPSQSNFIHNASPNDKAFLKHHPNIYFPRTPIINHPRPKAQTFFYSPTHTTTTTIPSENYIPSQNHIQLNRNTSKSPQQYTNNFFPRKQIKCINNDPSKACCTNAVKNVQNQKISSPPRVVWAHYNPLENNKLIEKVPYYPNFNINNNRHGQIN